MMDVFRLADPGFLITGKLFFALVCFVSLLALWRYALVEWSRQIDSWTGDRRRLVVFLSSIALLTVIVGYLAVREIYQAGVIAFSGRPWI